MLESSRRTFLRGMGLVAAFLGALAMAGDVHAATAAYSVALDTDNNGATGCVVAVSGGSVSGVEQVITTVVDTTASGATVTRLERRICSGGNLGAASTYDAGGWPVGFGNGRDGTSVIETSVPLSFLRPGATIRATAFSTAGSAQDATSSFVIALDPAPIVGAGGPIVPVPLSPWLVPPLAVALMALAAWARRRYPQQTGLFVLAAIFAVSGLVWAASVIRDGQVGDWAGVSPAVSDPRGDAAGNADLVAVFFQQDGVNLYFRIDADVRTEGANQRPQVNAGNAQTITLPALAALTGTASDDGLPNPPGALTSTWSKVSGAGTVTFADAHALSTMATFPAAGTYVLRLTASDSLLAASSDVTITVNDTASGPSNPALQIAALPDRTVQAGNRLQVVVQASDANGDRLTYALTTAPSGATLNPAPLIDWVPTSTQAGVHPITARVTDGHGHTASASFNVTVTVPANNAPVLGGQPNQTVAVGTEFTRTLSASDADTGDTLTYSLVSGPAGMTLAGNGLDWTTTGRTAGDYAVTVRVTDSKGAYDQKSFTVTLQASAPPLAKDDSYTVKPGGTLTVAAPGVLGNDENLASGVLAAQKLTNPTKGTLGAFGSDGSFTYVAPASAPPPISLAANTIWQTAVRDNTGWSWAADLNHDGAADHITLSFGVPSAIDGKTGATLWAGWDTSPTSPGQNCGMYLFGTDFALGDVDGSGNITYIAATQCEAKYNAGVSTRLIGVDTDPAHAVGGAAAVKWVGERLDAMLPASPSVGAPPVLTYVVNPQENGLANFATPTLARITPAGGVKVLTRALVYRTAFPYDSDGDGSRETNAACAAVTGNLADLGQACKATFIVNAVTGAKEAALVAPNPYNETESITREPMRITAPVVADLDGDGQVEIISGSEVFKYDGTRWTLAWVATLASAQRLWEPTSVAVADVDGDGTAEVIYQAEWDQDFVRNRGYLIYRHDGTLLSRFTIPTWDVGPVAIADVDGDGAPELVFAARGIVYAYKVDGTLAWASEVPDDDITLPGEDTSLRHWPNPTSQRTRPGAGTQIYDLDLDGKPEVIVAGAFRLAIFDGATGNLRTSFHNNSYGQNHGMPLVVDANGDGHADIVSSGIGGGVCADCPAASILAFSGVDRNWAPVAPILNQMSYNPWAVNDAGAILYDGGVHRTFRVHRQRGTVVDPRTRDTDSFTYTATGAGGTSAPAKVSVQIVPQNSPPVITSTPPSSIFAVADRTGTYPTFVYKIAATDPDVGDTVHYELVYSSVDTNYFPQATVDATTGVMRMYTGPCGSFGGPCDFGPMVFIVAAVDSLGARAEQGFVVDVVSFSRSVPNVVGQLVDDAKGALKDVQLVPRVSEVYDAHPVGTVIDQNPAAGTTVGRSATVVIAVSKGPRPVTMPFVVGQQLAKADATLRNLGLRTNVTPLTSSTVPAGEVMTQSPAFGTSLDPGTAAPVALAVSTGGPLAAPIASIVLTPGPGPLARLVGEDVQFQATAILTDGTSADVTATGAWSSSSTTAASVSVTGAVQAKAAGPTTISVTQGGKTGQVTLNVAAIAAIDITPPAAAITSPAEGSRVTGPMPVIGTASDPSFLRYELAISPAGEDTWTVLAEGTGAITNGTLGTLDPTALLNDLYTLRLTVFDRGQNSTTAEATVQVAGGRKPGLFTLDYQDLNIAASGIPLTVERIYDSRDKATRDFGIGWRLGMQTLRIRTNRTLGTGWVRVVSGPNVSLQPTSEHKVSVTLPDDRVEEFDMQVSPTSNIGSLDATNVTGFTPRAGTLGQLEAIVNNGLLIVSAGALDELVDDTTLDTYQPKLYRYTTPEGVAFEISPAEGVKKVTDRYGNAVTFGPDGVRHSDGTGIVFTRDAKGRIVSIVDAAGKVQSYAYDGRGDLVSHIAADGGVSSYKYDRMHGLIEIRDPAGRTPLRSEYDASGRLLSLTDASGKKVTFTHSDATNEEIVTDRLGNVSRLTYDGDGNVARQERAVTIDGALVSAISTFAYDALGNRTSSVDPDGMRTISTFHGVAPLTRVVDAGGLDLTTSFVYGAFDNVTSATDAGGRAYGFAYAANGSITSATVPGVGNVILVTDAKGAPIERRDPLGNRLVLTRDAAGRIVRQDALDSGGTLLARFDFTWDANGNKTSETLHRDVDGVTTALTTTYAYDAAGRLVAVTDPLGGVTRTEYDASGRVTAEIDALGRRKEQVYDTLGRRVRTNHPDGTFETSSYDANGNEIATTDRAGRTTTYAYDELGRRVRTTLPDGSSTQVILTAAGRIAATIDARGARTDYAYDGAGRRTATTQPAVADGPGGTVRRPQTLVARNALGDPASVTDANGHVTSYQYDGSGRVTRTTHPDGTFAKQTWDVLGKRTGVTDEEDRSTSFSYDGLGRLRSVAGLEGTVDATYDQAGNRVQQTDALGRVTRFRYDALNRLVERVYPGGESEKIAYDAVGNAVAKTDALGRITTFVYDVMNRPIRKTLPDGASVTYSYAGDGQRLSVTDSRGATTYAYDAAGRLASVTHPTGEAVTYSHDPNGNLLSLASPGGTVSYAYDALDRLTQVTAPEGGSSNAYDLVGHPVRQTAANGIVTDRIFDSRSRPTSITHRSPGGAILQSYALTYSASGRRTGLTEADGSTESYGYDARGRLVAETRTGTHPFTRTHAYDAVGNRLQTVANGAPATFTYDANDRLLSDGTATYSWDANGNLVGRTAGGTSTQYGYDAQRRLVAISGGGLALQYGYDDDGHRVLASSPGGTTRFLVDAASNTGLSQVLEERDGGGALKARYTYGLDMLAQARAGGSAFVLRDGLGSVGAIADASGIVTDRYTFDGFGTTVAASGGSANPYRYRGERLDAESGLYQLRARYYDPGQGRFLTRDPLGGDLAEPSTLHRYAYAANDPINFADPTGMEYTLTSVAATLSIISITADIVSFGATIAGQQELATAAGVVGLLTGLASIPFSIGKAAVVETGKMATEQFLLRQGTAKAAVEVMEARARRLAAEQLARSAAGRGLLEATEASAKQVLETVTFEFAEQGTKALEEAAVGYARVLYKEMGPRIVRPMRDAILVAFKNSALSGAERTVANSMVAEFGRMLTYLERGLLL